MQCKKHFEQKIFLRFFLCMNRYDSDRRKCRGRSGGEKQKLQYKLKKEMKVTNQSFVNGLSFMLSFFSSRELLGK